ncbi:hypothetical protein B7486_16545 [cyanobacterium TDX16]|nr:hypothetical protein B7486_16545 [cyanobacterium TDX16]
MPTQTEKSITLGEIARRTGANPSRVRYIIETRNIHPAARAGHIGIYTESDLQFIASELRRIDADKAGGTR